MYLKKFEKNVFQEKKYEFKTFNGIREKNCWIRDLLNRKQKISINILLQLESCFLEYVSTF